MSQRIFQDNEECRLCDVCRHCKHHWLVCMFAPGDTDDPEYLGAVQKWWEERRGAVGALAPMYWACKHCTAWTPFDPDDCCCDCMAELKTEEEIESQMCANCIRENEAFWNPDSTEIKEG